MSWLLKGLLIGAAIAVTGVLIAGTGGLAAVAIVGGAAAMGAGLGEAMSTMSFAPKEVTGAIATTGSTDVFINGLAAARAHIDMALCSKHPGPPIPIATGSGQVYINGQPAARVDDKTGCGGSITKASGNVYIGGGTQQTDTINPENLVPGWVHASLLIVGVGSAIVLAGPVVAVGGLIGAFAGGYGGGWLGGKVFGEGSDGQKWSAIAGSFLGGFLGAKAAPKIPWTRQGAASRTDVVAQNGGTGGSRYPRTEGLGTHSSMAEMKATGALPGEHGVIITDRTVRFGDVYELGTLGGRKIEFALVTERIDGAIVKKLYSGDGWSSPVPRDARLIGHVHPNDNSMKLWPSTQDMNMVNARYFRELSQNPDARPAPTRIFWGAGDTDNTIFYPGFNKDPIPVKGR
ncbi:PAAR domain-containing protein [Pseudoduganella plicata]|nr:PAAR domain-containing protein [Pseudoduganella plicata]